LILALADGATGFVSSDQAGWDDDRVLKKSPAIVLRRPTAPSFDVATDPVYENEQLRRALQATRAQLQLLAAKYNAVCEKNAGLEVEAKTAEDTVTNLQITAMRRSLVSRIEAHACANCTATRATA
jgi:hypothetical protein